MGGAITIVAAAPNACRYSNTDPSKLGVEKCTLVGVSYGGMVGFKMAEMYPDLVESMVVTCSVMGLTESVTNAALERIGYESWVDFLLPKTADALKVQFDIACYKLPTLPAFVYKHILEVCLLSILIFFGIFLGGPDTVQRWYGIIVAYSRWIYLD